MAESSVTTRARGKRHAVVTGGNKGIGLEICRQLASSGIVVVLTARDVNRGFEAVKKLKEDSGVPDDLLFFHQLDVVDPDSIVSLVDFVKTRFEKLDILVNNAAIGGIMYVPRNFRRGFELCGGNWPDGKEVSWNEMASQTYEMAEQCVKTNYYAAKAVTEALIPLLNLSESARIVNVSAKLGQLQFVPNEWAKGLLSDIEHLTEEKIDEVVNQFFKDYKDGLLESRGWPIHTSGYIVSKVALNAYTRTLAKRYPTFLANAVHPGFCKTDITSNLGIFTAAEGAEHIVRVALLPNDGPSGYFFDMNEISCFSIIIV